MLGRIVAVFVRTVIAVALLSAILSLAVTSGAIDVGLGDGEQIDTPHPLPDWPFNWDIVIENESSEVGSPAQLDDDTAVGEPVTDDPGTSSVGPAGSVTSDAVEVAIHERINEIRTEAGLSSLEHDDEIANIARTYSHDMAERDFFAHVSPEGERPADRFGDLFPNSCRAIGENLAVFNTVGTTDAETLAERIVDGWMESPGHRDNILTESWDRQGIGVYADDSRVYATQKFCDSR
ncbi:CAP domain-containing protein [Natrialbaceae archaeon A-CW2]|uniref:CAP domain-containing protein n=1 Tax=Natronosalvus amylolyticus TaxID=2961994 RepID=UPI0020C94D94|nr:CAP domain-containing protein [Natronosalvus amylolyticus]